MATRGGGGGGGGSHGGSGGGSSWGHGGGSGGHGGGGRYAVPSPGAGYSHGREPSHGGHGGYGHGGYYGHDHYGHGHYGYGYPYYGYAGYYPWYYYGYGPGYGWGWWGDWYGWWWPWGPATVGYAGSYGDSYHNQGSGYGALDVDVSPGNAQIYVDGSMVGTADDYDGFPSYLWLPQGTYDVVIFLDGYQTIARQISIYDGLVIDVNDHMQPGQAIHPEDLPAKTHERRDERLQHEAEQQDAARRREEWERQQQQYDAPSGDYHAPAHNNAPPTVGAADSGTVARLHVTVTPPDASVYLDGNFVGTAREIQGLSAGLIVSPGSHRLEVVRPGYEQRELSFDGHAGQDVNLDVQLEEE